MSTAAEFDYHTPGLFIGGQWRAGRAASSNEVINPATEQVLGRLGHASRADLDDALAAAEQGFAHWRGVPAPQRAELLRRVFEEMAARRERIATLVTLEQGKPLKEARGEVDIAIAMMRWYAEQAVRVQGRIVPAGAGLHESQVRKEPIGPVLLLTPWNMPVILTAWKLGAALAAGCSCIVKPAEETPAAVAEMVDCFRAAGLPEGVLNLVYGVPAEVSSYLLASPVLRKVSFTGSVPVGRLIARQAAESFKRVTLELGGHGPAIVLADADLDAAVAALVAARFRNAGQICHAPTRFLVEAEVYEAFIERFVTAAEALRVGDGLDPATQMGPLSNARRLTELTALVDQAREQGALVCGGRRLGERGYFYAPTVLRDLPLDAPIMQCEPFGPVALMRRVDSLDEAIAAANATAYGLAAYAYTDSARAQRRLVEELRFGTVAINTAVAAAPQTPFGGDKDSGYGHEGGEEGMEGFLRTKTVHLGA